MNKRKLRRVTIVALVLVLLCNTLGVQAETGASHSLHKRLTACKCYGTCNCIHSRG